jgi:anti-sigma factor RsiW
MSATDSKMALPEELLDELLSAHLDDALSGDERARVEQMLSEDPTIEQRFESLRRQRQEFREAAFAVPKLPEGFANKIVQAAIDQAQAEGLRTDHPLQLAAQKALVSRTSADSFSGPRLVAVLVGLAASALFVVGLLANKYSSDSRDSQIAIATIEQPIENRTVTDPSHSAIAVTDPIPASAKEREPLVPPGPETAIASSDVVSSNNDARSIDDSPIDLEAIEPELSQPMLAEASDAASPRVVNDGSPSNPVAEAAEPAPLSMVMVVEVKQTKNGRLIDAFNTALVNAQIEVSEERLVNMNLARMVDNGPSEKSSDSGSSQVILLESPAKKLDLLVNRLFSEPENFSSVGFSLLSDAPLLRPINSARRIDPTEIRHEAFPIGNQSEQVFDAWANQLGDRVFAPMQDSAVAKTVVTSSTGPDQISNILFLIRAEDD